MKIGKTLGGRESRPCRASGKTAFFLQSDGNVAIENGYFQSQNALGQVLEQLGEQLTLFRCFQITVVPEQRHVATILPDLLRVMTCLVKCFLWSRAFIFQQGAIHDDKGTFPQVQRFSLQEIIHGEFTRRPKPKT